MANRVCPPEPVESQHVPQIPAPVQKNRKKKRREKRSFVDNCNHIFETHSSSWMTNEMPDQKKERVMGQTQVTQLRSIIYFNKPLL